jgi:hypothetical protein
MPRLGSQALIVGRRDHLDLEQLRETTPGLFRSLDQFQAGCLVLLVSLSRSEMKPSAMRPMSYLSPDRMTAMALFTP